MVCIEPGGKTKSIPLSFGWAPTNDNFSIFLYESILGKNDEFDGGRDEKPWGIGGSGYKSWTVTSEVIDVGVVPLEP